MKNLVVFDLDHTLLRANCSFAFGSYLFRHRVFNIWSILQCLIDYTRHRFFALSMQELHQNAFDRLFKYLSIDDIRYHVKLFLNKNFDKLLYLPAIKRLKEAKQKGDYLVLLSSSPDFLVKPIAQLLDIPHYAATVYQTDFEGKLMALGQVMDGFQKANYLKNCLCYLQYPFASITMYSDSHLDLPLLNLANQVIGVKPSTSLKQLCIKNQWEII